MSAVTDGVNDINKFATIVAEGVGNSKTKVWDLLCLSWFNNGIDIFDGLRIRAHDWLPCYEESE